MQARSMLRGLPTDQDVLLGDPDVCIAVLDGPVDLSHPCFEGGNLTRLDTLVQEPAGPGPMSLHGTHVTSLLFGQPGSSVTGIAPRCRGLILPVFRDVGEGKVSQLDLARAIERAVQEGASVINVSGGERTEDGQPESMLARALRLCEDRGVLVVAAVGNDGCDCLQVPAAVPSVLAVGAASADGEPLESSNWGASYRTNGVSAPGEDMEGAAPGGRLATLTGSSFAAPMVSGVAALLLATQLRLARKVDPLAVGRAILETASSSCLPRDAAECRRYLVGHLDAGRAYELVRHPVSLPDVALVPYQPAQPGSRGAEAFSPEPEVKAAPEPSSLGQTDPEPNEGASAMDANRVHVTAGGEADDTHSAAWGSAEGNERRNVPAAGADGSEHLRWQRAGDVSPEPEVVAAGQPLSLGPPNPESDEGADAVDASRVTAHREGPTLGDRAGDAGHGPLAGPALDGATEQGIRASCEGGGEGSPPSSCACGGNGPRPLIYAIGTIGFDFQTEARRDSFRQQMDPVPGPTTDDRETEYPPNPYDPKQLRHYLMKNPWASDKLTWTLNMDSTPIYALEAETPVGLDWSESVFSDPSWSQERVREAARSAAGDTGELAKLLETLMYPPVSTVYRVFRDAIVGQVLNLTDEGFVSRVSVPGVLTDRTTRLFSGQVVPVVKVKGRGIYTWNETALIKSVSEAIGQDPVGNNINDLKATAPGYFEKTVRAFLDKIYYQFRNLGQSSSDRALNYAGTNAFLFGSQISEGLLSAKTVPGSEDHFYALDSIRVSKSPHCRVGSDCQDVIITFFDPEDERRSRVHYLFTVDVSDEHPVSLAPVHTFLGEW
ncbi:S8 family serine peptidase [Streptomyces sp. NPDC089795]|uniref:cyanobactin maturation protease PatG family protein n=1 Tax=Streptomyces sp. NPDC089795 TaxID=3155297 RepID=UPI003445BE12